MRRLILAIMVALSALSIAAPIVSAAPECSPGQHGNPHPGFKPGSC